MSGPVAAARRRSGSVPAIPTGATYRYRTADAPVLANGAQVASAVFQTGTLTLSQATAGARPTYLAAGQGGKPALRFDGVDDNLASATGPTIAQPFSLHLILDVKSTSGTREFLHANIDAVINDGALQYNAYAGTQISGGTPTTGFHNLDWVYDTTTRIVADGTVVVSGSAGTGSFDTPITLGAHATAGRYAQMDLYEVLLYPRNLSAAEITALRAYSSAFYGA